MAMSSIGSIKATISNMPLSSLVLVSLLLACAVLGVLIVLYVGVRTAMDARKDKRARRLRRKARSDARAALHQERSRPPI